MSQGTRVSNSVPADVSRRPAPEPTLVILAGGASARLGTCKALVQLGPRTALEHLLAAGSACSSAAPIEVTGRHDALIAAAVPMGVRLVHNPAWELGRTGSLQVACLAAPGQDLCIAPVDVPLVPAAVFAALARAWAEAGAPALGWLAPRCEPSEGQLHGPGDPGRGRYGHPVLLGRELLARVAAGTPAEELRSFRSLAAPLWSIPVSGTEILDDLDNPDDLRRLRRRFEPPTPPGRSPD